MKFSKEILQELAWSEDPDGFVRVENEIENTGRWSVFYRMVFRAPDGKLYESHYSKGATEYQDERPYEDDDDEVECQEVEAVEKTIVVYQRVNR